MVRADEFVYHSEEGWYNFKELGEFVARFHENDIAGFAIKDSVE